MIEFVHTGLVPRLPTALLATGLMLHRVPVADERTDPGHGDARPLGDKRLAYLSIRGPQDLPLP